jgi:Nuclease-related domain
MNMPAIPDPQHAETRKLQLRYAAACTRCGRNLAKGEEALYDPSKRTVRCIVCESAAANAAGPVEALEDSGVPGASADREYKRRKSARDDRVRGRLGDLLGGVVLAISDEPQSTRAWARGATGERKLADALEDVPELKILNDRRVPQTNGNIDHILVAPTGVFIVDAKYYKGLIQIRDKGGFFKTDKRLYVGGRDCSHLAENMGWQVEAVQRALSAAAVDPMPPITPVLCFIDGDWPLLFPPEEYKAVRLEGKRSIKKLIAGARVLDRQAVDHVYHALAVAFPPK